jgi:Uma2 family endonuclease
VSSSDLRLRVTRAGLYTYPDVMVVCGEAEVADDRRDTVLNPILIIEVLSESTRAYDRGREFQHYRTLPSLIEYLTIEQDEPRIEHWTRQREDHWDFVAIDDLTKSVELASIGCVLPLAGVYDRIEWQGTSGNRLLELTNQRSRP